MELSYICEIQIQMESHQFYIFFKNCITWTAHSEYLMDFSKVEEHTEPRFMIALTK